MKVKNSYYYHGNY